VHVISSLLLSTDVSMAPTEVQMLSIASTSAVVGWMPADSSLEHVVTVNNIVRTTIRPGGYRCTISGIQTVSNTSLAVSVK
jgi:RIMS-binding protein 2